MGAHKKTHCKNGHLLEGDNVKWNSDCNRQCRRCRNKRDRERLRAKRKQKAMEAK